MQLGKNVLYMLYISYKTQTTLAEPRVPRKKLGLDYVH